MSDIDRLRAALGSRYTIDREVGAGGMATVYLAEDPKHRRKVAIKVLRPELSASLGAERFSREIEVAAQLQHPHILPLLDSGEADGFLYYVMPFVDGESLRERLAKHGELPVHEAIRILIEVVDALAHAHSRGVVHRDIKPDNIMVSGRHALVTDFGVAKAVSEATGRQKLTSIGIALGTPSYMAPEQATADPLIDHRVDIYAIGILAYELLTGHPPFAGRSPQEILAAHMTQDPEPVSNRRTTISPTLNDVVMKCLAKRPADRWQSAEELLVQLEPLMTPSVGTTPAQTRPLPAMPRVESGAPPKSRRAFWFVAGALVLAATAFATTMLPRRDDGLTMGRAQPIAIDEALEIDPAVSPDGQRVAYASGRMGRMRIYVRQQGSRAVPIAMDSANQRMPMWSPDGTQLLFIQGGQALVVPALGGVPRVAVNRGPNDAPIMFAAWSPDGKQLAYVAQDTLRVRGTEGGAARAIATGPIWGIAWSPDGAHIAYVFGDPRFSIGGLRYFGNIAPTDIRVVRVDGSRPPHAITDNRSLNVSPAWMPDSRRVLFVSNRDGPRDVYSTSIGGAIQAPRRVTSGLNPHSVTVSADGGKIAYAAYTSKSNIWAVPLKPGGVATMAEARQVTTGNQLIEAPAVSADGKRLTYDSDREGSVDVYRISVNGGEPERLTTDPAPEFNPSESPDGRWIVFHSFKYGHRDIFVIPSGGGEMTRLTSDSTQEQFPHWSPDGNAISFFRYGFGMPQTPYVMRRGSDGSWGPMQKIDGAGSVHWYDDTTMLVARGRGVEMRSINNKTWGLFITDMSKGFPPVLDIRVVKGVSYMLSYDVAGGSQYWRYTRGGTPQLIARLNDPMRPVARSEFDTDGRTLYVTVADRQSDVFVAELTRR